MILAKMADKQCSELDKSCGNLQLSTEITSMVLGRLSTVSKRLTEKQILKILSKRRKKWRKREGRDPELAEYAGVVPQLDKEKAAVSDAVEELSESLVAKRKEGMERARQMERDRSLHSLHVLIDRSKRLKQEVKRYKRVQHTAIPPPQPQPNYTEAQETLLQDLEKAISQAQEYRKLTMMKFHMTPRPPAINRRNIADSRMHNGFSLPSDNPLFTPEHQHVPSDNIATSGHHLVTSSEKLNEYLLEVQLPTIAQTIEATSEELNFAAEMQKVTTEQRHNCDSDDTQHPVLEDTLGETEDPELLKLVSAVKNLPKDTRS